MNSSITRVQARRIWDSRGRPTVEVDVLLADGSVGRGIAPAGASTGSHEAVELRDGGEAFGGYGVQRAIDGIGREIAPALAGRDARAQEEIDQLLVALDGTPNKARLGGNALIATSMAVLDAAARSARLPLWRYLAGDAEVSLPLPEIQIFGGGAHAGRRVDIQDFLVMPVGAADIDEALAMVAEVYRAAGQLMADSGRRAGVADEGGWWPDFDGNEDALQMLARAIEKAGYRHGEVMISLDIAASEFGRDGVYRPALEGRAFTTDEWIAKLLDWVAKYPILSVEDPVAEDDTAGMIAFTQQAGGRVQVIGDDYLVTNAQRVRDAAAVKACNAVLIKPNQAGTISETRQALLAARSLGWSTVVSARSGESEDVMIAHLAVGWNAGQLKVGSFARSERMAKWNELLRIDAALGTRAPYAGRRALPV
ncbi:MAG: phosphopyruvate hydratase [Burkholderiaceae bacterium]|nr:phosphopyruvate hydratase [Burkholderiaceae bacterium]